MTLTHEQRAAAESTEPVTIVEAGAGSGKTTTLVARIVHLVQEVGIDPRRILALTFTRAAASEILTRTWDTLGDAAGRLFVQTFHGYAASITLREGERVATFREVDAAVRSVNEGPTRRPRGDVPGIKELGKLITAHEAGGYAADGTSTYPSIALLLSRLRAAHLVPLWDLVPRALILRPSERPAFDAVLVDEWQDTTDAERRVAIASIDNAAGAGTTVEGAGAVFVVGDPRQAIMGWRGAIPAFKIADVQTHKLTGSRRFGKVIADKVNALGARFGGDPVEGLSEKHGIVAVLERDALLLELCASGTKLILARTRHECRTLEDDLGKLARWAQANPHDPLSSDADLFAEIWGQGLAVISTVHAAKGREADTVIVCLDLERDPDDAEERRVDYVAATRARRRLIFVG